MSAPRQSLVSLRVWSSCIVLRKLQIPLTFSVFWTTNMYTHTHTQLVSFNFRDILVLILAFSILFLGIFPLGWFDSRLRKTKSWRRGRRGSEPWQMPDQLVQLIPRSVLSSFCFLFYNHCIQRKEWEDCFLISLFMDWILQAKKRKRAERFGIVWIVAFKNPSVRLSNYVYFITFCFLK